MEVTSHFCAIVYWFKTSHISHLSPNLSPFPPTNTQRKGIALGHGYQEAGITRDILESLTLLDLENMKPKGHG